MGDQHARPIRPAGQPALRRSAAAVGTGQVFPTGLLSEESGRSDATPVETGTDQALAKRNRIPSSRPTYFFSFLSLTSIVLVPSFVANSFGRLPEPGSSTHHVSSSPSSL